jgi:diguanylate cyclase (GGDEF)-like protein
MLLVDIDYFKAINDEHGHDAGDRVLQNLVLFLEDQLRYGDTIFRVGGEEFVLLLPGADLEVAKNVAEKIRASVSEATAFDGHSITISIGASESSHSDTSASWLKRCDEALYSAKAEGRNRVVAKTAGENT